MKKLLTVLFIGICISGKLFAGGFQLNDHSARSVGMGFSTVANIYDASALYFNPAAMVNIKSDLEISAGASYIMPGSKFTGITTLNQNDTYSTESWNFLIPNIYAAWKTPVSGLSFGVGFFAPFGLGSRWPDGWVGRHSALETYLQTLELNPNLSYGLKFGKNKLAFSAGFGYVMGNVELKQNLSTFNPEPLLDLKGDGNATTFNFGLNLELFELIKFGAAYRHNIEMEYSGNVTYQNVSGLEPLFMETTGGTKINLPNDLKVGIAFDLKKFSFEFGVNYTGWSSYDTLSINFANKPGHAVTPTDPPLPYTSAKPRNYKDVLAYRLGVEFKPTEELTFRCGVYYDPLAVNADDVEPVLPEANRFAGALGFGYKLNNMLTVDLGYLGIMGTQTEVKNNPNGFNGYYNAWANILSLTLNVHL